MIHKSFNFLKVLYHAVFGFGDDGDDDDALTTTARMNIIVATHIHTYFH